MFSLSSLDVYYLVKELRPLLEEAFVDKIYQRDGEFLIRMRSPKAGKQQLYIKAPDATFLTDHRFSWPQDPQGFCMQLRKHLSNSKMSAIEQHAFERIIELTFVKGSVSWKLVLELFSKGNIILVNSEGLIRGVWDLQRWKDRTLRVNAPYEYPPTMVDTPKLSEQELSELFVSSGLELVKFCATKLGLGGKYAEELVSRSGLDKFSTELSLGSVTALYTALGSMLSRDVLAAVHDGDAAPFHLQAWESIQTAASFSEAIEGLVVGEKTDAISGEAESVVVDHKTKYQRIIDEQTNKLSGYEQSAVENQRRGELIYERYQDMDALLSGLREAHETGGWAAVKDLIDEQGLPVSVNEKDGLVSFELPDA